MKKGTVFHLIAFVAALFLIGLVSFSLLLYNSFTIERKGVIQSDVINATNAMELVKKNLQQALTFSYYQASYEIAKNGGGIQPILIWRNYDNKLGYPSDFDKTLAKQTLERFNQYVNKLLEGSEITVENYKEVQVEGEEKGEREYIDALSFIEQPCQKDPTEICRKDGKIRISKFFVELSNKANVYVSIPIRTLELFRMGEKNFVSRDIVQERINAGIANAGLKSSHRVTSCEFVPTSDDVFRDANGMIVSAAEDFISNKVRDSLLGLTELSSDKINIKIDVLEVKSKVEPNCFGPTSYNPTCSSPEIYSTLTCNFNFFSSAKVKVEIVDNGKYPVYDSTVGMRNIQLNFNVISGNDYNKKLIQ